MLTAAACCLGSTASSMSQAPGAALLSCICEKPQQAAHRGGSYRLGQAVVQQLGPHRTAKAPSATHLLTVQAVTMKPGRAKGQSGWASGSSLCSGTAQPCRLSALGPTSCPSSRPCLRGPNQGLLRSEHHSEHIRFTVQKGSASPQLCLSSGFPCPEQAPHARGGIALCRAGSVWPHDRARSPRGH